MTCTGASDRLSEDVAAIVAGTLGEWDALRHARMFVTGGTGFIGCWLLESFGRAKAELGLEAEMTVLTRDPEAFARREPGLARIPGLRFCKGDVRSFVFPQERFTHVIHAATTASAKLNTESPLEMFDTIVTGTKRALDFAAHCGAKVFLQTSSGGVYGRQPAELSHIPEDFPGAPDPFDRWSAYGEGKRAAELLGTLYAARHGFEHKVARIFALVGPRLPLDIHYAMGNFIRDALTGGPIRVGGDGTPYRSYLYAGDLMIWLWRILVRGRPDRPYNVGSDRAVTIYEAAQAVNAAFGNRFEVLVARQQLPGQPGSRYVPDITRARDELGLVPKIGLEEGIRRTALWYAPRASAT